MMKEEEKQMKYVTETENLDEGNPGGNIRLVRRKCKIL